MLAVTQGLAEAGGRSDSQQPSGEAVSSAAPGAATTAAEPASQAPAAAAAKAPEPSATAAAGARGHALAEVAGRAPSRGGAAAAAAPAPMAELQLPAPVSGTDHMLTALMWALWVGIGAILLKKGLSMFGVDVAEMLQS